MVDFNYLSELSHSTSILEVLDYYGIEYQSSGTDRYKCICPFHNDHDPSLVLYVNSEHKNESFYCFVDNTGGDPFRFIELMEDDFVKSWSVLCAIRGIKDQDAFNIDGLDKIERDLQIQKENESVSVESYNSQISIMYRDFLLRNVESPSYKLLQEEVDKRFLILDDFLDSKPSSSTMRQFFLHELQYLSMLKTKV